MNQKQQNERSGTAGGCGHSILRHQYAAMICFASRLAIADPANELLVVSANAAEGTFSAWGDAQWDPDREHKGYASARAFTQDSDKNATWSGNPGRRCQSEAIAMGGSISIALTNSIRGFGPFGTSGIVLAQARFEGPVYFTGPDPFAEARALISCHSLFIPWGDGDGSVQIRAALSNAEHFSDLQFSQAPGQCNARVTRHSGNFSNWEFGDDLGNSAQLPLAFPNNNLPEPMGFPDPLVANKTYTFSVTIDATVGARNGHTYFQNGTTVRCGGDYDGWTRTAGIEGDRTFSLATSGPVFDLPEGWSADSPALNIVANRWLGSKNFPVVMVQPDPADKACWSKPVFFNVTVSGKPPFAYQWLKDGQEIAGETDAVLEIPHPTKEHVGIYECKITNEFGKKFSYPVPLYLCDCDLTCDRLILDDDFTVFLSGYDAMVCDDPSVPVGCPADFNRDGLVDDVDFGVFVKAYAKGNCAD